MSGTNPQKRYPGVKPFETSERDLFFGRDRDIEDLWNLMWLSKLVVLFGKSGYGKSSLINAGILPEISKEEATVPIVVRLGAYLEGQTPSPLDNLYQQIQEQFDDNPEADFLNMLDLPLTLWHRIKRKQSTQQHRFIFIFDQFEEFFTYPPAAQLAFKEQLAELLYTEVPQSLRNLHGSFELNQQDFIANPFEAKVLLAIRSDRLSLLDSMKDKLPTILQKRYELKGLSEDQAREAIERPAMISGDFASPPFIYSPEALRDMTQKLASSKSNQQTGIEAFQLQILCEYLEDKVTNGEIPELLIESHHFTAQIDEIFEGYYHRLLNKLKPNDRKAVQLLIEEKLVFEDRASGEIRRLSVDAGVLLGERGINQVLLNQLENNFLLRRETTSTGAINYELSHDTLLGPVLQTKNVRKKEEESLHAKRRKKRMLLIGGATIIAFTTVIGILFYILKINSKISEQALTSYADDLASKSQIALSDGERNTALRLAFFAHDYVDSNNTRINNAFIEAFHYNDNPVQLALPWEKSLIGHTSSVLGTEVSPDGKVILSASADQTIKHWDASSGKSIKTIKFNHPNITSLAFSKDGKLLATASPNFITKIWNPYTGKLQKSLYGDSSIVLSVAFSLNNQFLATACNDRTAKIWDLATGKLVYKLSGHKDVVESVAFSPDGKYLASASADSTIRLWHVASGEAYSYMLGHQSAVLAVAFSPNSRYLATTSDDNTAKVWDLATGKIKATFRGYSSPVICARFSPNGRRLATACLDGTTKVWAIYTGEQMTELNKHEAAVKSISFSPDGYRIISASEDNTLKIWDVAFTKMAATIYGSDSPVQALAYSPNGRYLAVSSGTQSAKIWDMQSYKLKETFTKHSSFVTDIAYSPDGEHLATASWDNTVLVWHIASKTLIHTLRGHNQHVSSVAFSPDGKYIATGAYDPNVIIWEMATGKVKANYRNLSGAVTNLCFSPNGKLLAIAAGQSSKIWYLYARKVKTIHASSTLALNVAFSPSGNLLATSSHDGTIKIWNTPSRKLIASFAGHKDHVGPLAFSHDGTLLASGSSDKTAKIWDVKTGKLISTLIGHNYHVLDLAFSPNGKNLATASLDGTAKIWDISLDSRKKIPWLSPLSVAELRKLNLETLLDLHPNNESKLIATRETWQIKAFADLAAQQAAGSNVLSKVATPYARANRLYAAALALQDEPLIRMDYAKMLRNWAAVYRDARQETKAKELEAKADKLWKP